MKHSETYTVTVQNGVRPMGPSDRCFYCNQPLGAQHKDDCVTRRRTVIVKHAFYVVHRVPEWWSKDDIDFYFNESSHCANNTVRDMAELRLDAYCWCGDVVSEYWGEATREDEDKFEFPKD